MSNNLIDEAEFLLHLAEENSITRLRNLLQEATAERALPILRRINQFYNGNNAEVLLSLAIRSFHQGQDDEAISFARRARELKPDDLRVALFFAAARGDPVPALRNYLLLTIRRRGQLTARELWASPQSVSFTTRLKRRGDEKDAGEIPGREPPNGGIINAIWRKRRERLADSSTTE